ncbi:hypothetical protein BG841_11930 [Marinobacter sp. X15-166B]|nr:hypothetical protein BG841_11930 [Marinobacter sp. X15-166B]
MLAVARRQLDQLDLVHQQTVTARVTEVLVTRKGLPEQLTLDIQGRSLRVQAALGDTALEAGDLVRLMRSHNELQLIGKLAATSHQQVAQALAQRLAWQHRPDTALAQLLAAVDQGVRTPTSAPGTPPQALPVEVRQAIQGLLALVPGSTELTSEAGNTGTRSGLIKQWLKGSGLFAESQLVRTPETATTDTKFAIGRIITALLASQQAPPTEFNRLTPLASHELVQAPLQFPNTLPAPAPMASHPPPTAGQLLKLMAGVLNRLTVNQLHSQILSTRGSSDGPAQATWLFDLPWLSPLGEPKLAQIRIEHQDHRGPQTSAARATVTEWYLNLALEPDHTGPLHFEVRLRQESVSARVWAERPATLRRIHDGLPALRQGLGALGLEVGEVDCKQGSPHNRRTQLEQRMVDTKA